MRRPRSLRRHLEVQTGPLLGANTCAGTRDQSGPQDGCGQQDSRTHDCLPTSTRKSAVFPTAGVAEFGPERGVTRELRVESRIPRKCGAERCEEGVVPTRNLVTSPTRFAENGPDLRPERSDVPPMGGIVTSLAPRSRALSG